MFLTFLFIKIVSSVVKGFHEIFRNLNVIKFEVNVDKFEVINL